MNDKILIVRKKVDLTLLIVGVVKKVHHCGNQACAQFDGWCSMQSSQICRTKSIQIKLSKRTCREVARQYLY